LWVEVHSVEDLGDRAAFGAFPEAVDLFETVFTFGERVRESGVADEASNIGVGSSSYMSGKVNTSEASVATSCGDREWDKLSRGVELRVRKSSRSAEISKKPTSCVLGREEPSSFGGTFFGYPGLTYKPSRCAN
jgi:hypothetical protein